ncbi:MAG: hypothetical protein M0R80_07630 [Proteobacteria bacterium]|jgi:hypothetical protein|nr:hypothetical protein [Pseudomonadota bacterium]
MWTIETATVIALRERANWLEQNYSPDQVGEASMNPCVERDAADLIEELMKKLAPTNEQEAVYRGYTIHKQDGFYLISEVGDCDCIQEPFYSINLAKAAIDRFLDFGVQFHMGG